MRRLVRFLIWPLTWPIALASFLLDLQRWDPWERPRDLDPLDPDGRD